MPIRADDSCGSRRQEESGGIGEGTPYPYSSKTASWRLTRRDRCGSAQRCRDDIGRFAAAAELTIARAQSQLRFPGDLADRPGCASCRCRNSRLTR
jgi:hypothetical protein